MFANKYIQKEIAPKNKNVDVKSLFDKRLFIYDFETTGFWHPCNQPIEVAIKIVEKNGKEIDYHSYVSYDKHLNTTVQQLTKINNAMLAEHGRPIKKVFKEINELLDVPNTLVIGHNSLRFDNLFLNNYLQLYEYKQIGNWQCFDTAGQMKADLIKYRKGKDISWGEHHYVALGKRVEGINYKLITACEHYGVPFTDGDFHNAPSDVKHTKEIFLKQIQLLKTQEENKKVK